MRLVARPHLHSTPQYWLIRALGIALLAIVVAGAGFAIGSRAGVGQQPDRAGELQALIERAGGVVVYSEFGENADTIWAANPNNPDDRFAIGSAAHATGYGVVPSLSPDGNLIAYTAANGRDHADLWLLDVAIGDAQRLTVDVDLSAPIWSNESDAVVVRRSSSGDGIPENAQLLRIDLAGGVSTLASADAALYPIEFAPHGMLYYTSVSASGTDLHITNGVGSDTIAKLSDSIARDWDLSPDGKRLAYLSPRAAGGYAATVLDTVTGEAAKAVGEVASSSGPEFSPIWAPDSSLTVGRLGETLDGDGRTAGGSGFDVPLCWSPNGAHLIVRRFEGTSSADPGPSWLWVIDATGQQHRLSDISDIVVAGWLVPSP